MSHGEEIPHQAVLTGKKGFIQENHNREKRLNSTLLKEKEERFLSIGMSSRKNCRSLVGKLVDLLSHL